MKAPAQDKRVKKYQDGIVQMLSKVQASEFRKCAADLFYFMEHHVRIQNPSKGAILFDPRDYQRELLAIAMQNRFTVFNAPRQVGKSISIATLLLWYLIFNSDFKVGIAANKLSSAKEILNRLRYSYEELPYWLKPSVVDYNKFSISFDNNSAIESGTTTENSFRGRSLNIIYLDEFSHVNNNIAQEFWTALLPTISADGNDSSTKVIITSTPNGTEGIFAQVWFGAVNGDNGFVSYKVDPARVPGRDEAFKQEMLKKMTQVAYEQEFNGSFLSSKGTLINSMILESLRKKEVLSNFRGTNFFLDPHGRRLIMGADVGTGIGSDFSTIEIFDLDTLEQVGEFRSNVMNETQFTKEYIALLDYLDREALVKQIYYSVENNSYGLGVLRLIDNSKHSVFNRKYVNLVNSFGQKLPGVGCNTKTKKLACAKLKDLIENYQLKIYSERLLSELRFFVKRGETFKAENGANDDLVSACLIVTAMLDEISHEDDSIFEKMNKATALEHEEDENAEGFMPIVF